MKYVIFYWSRFGHNKKIANTLSEKLDKKGETKVVKVDQIDTVDIPEADLYVFSAPAEAFRVQRNMRTFMKKINDVEGKKFAVVNTHSMKRNWLKSMEKILTKKNMMKVASVDFQIGKEGQKEGQGFIGNWQEKLDEFADKL